jgi:hypothetical protein
MDIDVIVDPFKDFVTIILEYLPSVIGALALVLVVWIIARVLRSIVRRGFAAAKVDQRFNKAIGEEEAKKLPIAHTSGTVVYWFIWLLSIPAILGVLNIEGLSGPVEDMVAKVLSALPNIFAAVLVLIFAWYIGRFLAKIVTNVLTRARFNEVPAKLGIMKHPAEGGWTPSSVVGWIVLFLVMLFAILMAADLLDFAFVNELVADFTAFTGHVILAIVILGIGLFLANMAAKAIRAMGRTQSRVLALGAQAVILLLTIAIALRTLGIANEIVELGFGIVVGAVAVAVAIAFGLGGREFAKGVLDRLDKSLKGDK